MKRFLTLIVTSALMFGGSAFVSWNMARQKAPPTDSAEAETTLPGPARDHDPLGKTPPPRSTTVSSPGNAQSAHSSGTEEAVQLAANLRARLSQVRDREARLDARQKHLDLIYQDIRAERGAIEALRKQILEELKKTPQAAPVVTPTPPKAAPTSPPNRGREQKSDELLPTPKRLGKEDGKNAAPTSREELAGNAAMLLEKLASSGKMDAAVKLLAGLPQKQAAKVLSDLTDPDLASRLLAKLRESKPASLEPSRNPVEP